MSCTAATAKRRRRQAANGYGHMDPMKRPHYAKTTKEKSAAHMMEVIKREQRMAAGKKK